MPRASQTTETKQILKVWPKKRGKFAIKMDINHSPETIFSAEDFARALSDQKDARLPVIGAKVY